MDKNSDLTCQEQQRTAEAKLEATLLEGLDSGPMQKMVSEDWDMLRDRLRERWSMKKQSS